MMDDVVIIGGGPAGSAMGCFLSKAGIPNMIFEGVNHPRPHVGESMVTSSTRIFDEIGFLEVMEREGFVHKYGASWHTSVGGQEAAIRFDEFPQEGIDQGYTYHVDRQKFDLLLLKQAEKLGARVHQGVSVTKVLFDEEEFVSGVRIRVANQEMDIPCKMVVDASGRGTLLGRQLRLKKNDPIFDQYAVHAWYEDVDKSEHGTEEFIHIYFLPVERGWAWQIPITDKITSMGVVAERSIFRQARLDVEAYFNHYVNSNPDLARAMKSARRVNEFKSEGDYSYSMDKLVGNGYVLVGDAARFVDPIFSSGVSIALYSAKFASESIRRAVEQNDFRQAMLMPYETKLRSGTEIWYEFIRLYYKLLPLFTHFIQSDKYRLQILRLLQGEVFERDEVPVLDEMRRFIEKVESAENHLFKEQLTAIPV
jgi:1H-pyrrole-2-carbonyl-[peptidyl-carrier protein] chlorinase